MRHVVTLAMAIFCLCSLAADAQNKSGQRFFNGYDSLYEKLPGGGFRDLRDGSVWDSIPQRKCVANIAPYRREIMIRIGKNWSPSKVSRPIVVAITIANDGKLLNSEIVASSGSKRLDRSALRAVRQTIFPPLPDWYKGEQLHFKIAMDKVAAFKE